MSLQESVPQDAFRDELIMRLYWCLLSTIRPKDNLLGHKIASAMVAATLLLTE